jgi:hypothetical protein
VGIEHGAAHGRLTVASGRGAGGRVLLEALLAALEAFDEAFDEAWEHQRAHQLLDGGTTTPTARSRATGRADFSGGSRAIADALS